MSIHDKRRSLHCRFQAGLVFSEIDGEPVIYLQDLPLELEDIISTWLLKRDDDSLLRKGQKGMAMTEHAWGLFVGWMTDELFKSVHEYDGKPNDGEGQWD